MSIGAIPCHPDYVGHSCGKIETDLTKTWLKVSRYTFPTYSYESEVLGDTIRKKDSICQLSLGTMHTPSLGESLCILAY